MMMVSNAALIRRSNDMAREFTEPRTMYVIKLTKTGVYLRARFTWTQDAQHASRFEFMTTALIYAFAVLELASEDFDVECIKVSA